MSGDAVSLEAHEPVPLATDSPAPPLKDKKFKHFSYSQQFTSLTNSRTYVFSSFALVKQNKFWAFVFLLMTIIAISERTDAQNVQLHFVPIYCAPTQH